LNQNRYAYGYISTVAIASVVRAKLMVTVSPLLILLLSSLFGCVYFHLVTYKQCLKVYQKFFIQKRLFFQINVTVMLIWLATYYSIYFSSAAVFVFEFFTIGGCISLFKKHAQNALWQKISVLLMLLCMLIPFLLYPSQYLGITLAMLGGIMGYVYNALSGKAAVLLELQSSQLLAIRFWLLIFLSLMLLPASELRLLSWPVFLNIIAVSVASFILQIWLNQRSVITIGTQMTAYISSFTPALTFLFQGIILHDWVLPIFFLSLIGSGFMLLNTYCTIKNIKPLHLLFPLKNDKLINRQDPT